VEKQEKKRIFWLSIAAVGPSVVFSVYMVFSRWPQRRFTVQSETLALVLSMLVALAALMVLFRGRDLFIAILVFIPTATFLLGICAFIIGCAFGDCL